MLSRWDEDLFTGLRAEENLKTLFKSKKEEKEKDKERCI